MQTRWRRSGTEAERESRTLVLRGSCRPATAAGPDQVCGDGGGCGSGEGREGGGGSDAGEVTHGDSHT